MRRHQLLLTTAIAVASIFVAGCAGPAVAPTSAPAATTVVAPSASVPTTAPAGATTAPTSAPTTATAADPTTAPTVAPTAAGATPTAASSTSTTPVSQAAASSAVRYNIVADGTKADYRVREQLAKLKAPSDAVGTTKDVTGVLVVDADGKIDSNQSKITVDLTTLQTDSSMRDGFIQHTTLDARQYPNATFVPTSITGLASPLPTSGQHTFKMLGNLTIHGVTKPVTFDVTAQASGNDVTSQASTTFKFEDFGMSPPKSFAVLSVVDNVKLEVTLHLTRSA